MARIFISYSRADSLFVGELVPLLTKIFPNHMIWYDADIIGGEDWWQRILHEIGTCDIFLYLLSNDSIRSTYCQAEFREALRLHKPCLPVIVRQKTDVDNAPDDLRGEIRRRNWIDMSGGFKDARANADLYASINVLVGQIPSQVLAPLHPDPVGQPSVNHDKADRTPYIVAVIGAVTLIIAALIWIIPPLLNARQAAPTNVPPTTSTTGTIVAVQPTAITLTSTSTESPTLRPRYTPTATSTPIPADVMMVTLDFSDTQTAAAQMTAMAQQWTKTPILTGTSTPNVVGTANAMRTQRALATISAHQTEMQQAIIYLTGTASQWTKTPTPTYALTATFTATPIPSTVTLSFTPTPVPPTDTPVLPTSAPATISIGGSGGKIAFASSQDGRNKIYVVNDDGSGLHRLTETSSKECCFAWSPDGVHISFSSLRENNTAERENILDIDSGKLWNPSGWGFYWSSDGKQVAFNGCCGADKEEIYIADADGTNARRITTMGSFGYWSPDGKHIAFKSGINSAIYVVDIVDGSQRQLAPASGLDQNFSWSPNSTRVLYVTKLNGRYEIFAANVDGTDSRNLSNSQSNDWDPSWSPDGIHVVFSSDRDGNKEIYVVDADGQNLLRLTKNSSEDGSTVWSPDSKHIAFTSWQDGNKEIYVVDADGQNLRNLSHNNNAKDEGPVWSPDGKHIAFFSGHGQTTEIYVVDVTGDNLHSLTKDYLVARSFDWSPDGTRIVYDAWRDGILEINITDSDGKNLRNLLHQTQHDDYSGWPRWQPSSRS